MSVLNKLHHSDAQWAALQKQAEHGPVFMTNSLKFREPAEYADSRTAEYQSIRC